MKVLRFLITGSINVSHFSSFQLVAHPFFRGGDVRGLKKFNPGPVSVKSFALFFAIYSVIEHFPLFVISGPFQFECEAAPQTMPERWRRRTEVNEQCGACIEAVVFDAKGAVYAAKQNLTIISIRIVKLHTSEE